MTGRGILSDEQSWDSWNWPKMPEPQPAGGIVRFSKMIPMETSEQAADTERQISNYYRRGEPVQKRALSPLENFLADARGQLDDAQSFATRHGANSTRAGLGRFLGGLMLSPLETAANVGNVASDALVNLPSGRNTGASWGDYFGTALAGVSSASALKSMFGGQRRAAQAAEHDAYTSYLANMMSPAQRMSPGQRDLAILGAKPLSMDGASISKNLGSGQEFVYGMFRNGEPFGQAYGRVHGDKVNFDWLGGLRGDANSIGISGIRRLREQIRSDFPNVKNFEGYRVSGSRGREGIARDDKTQKVQMNEHMIPFGVGGAGILDILSRYGLTDENRPPL